jgi:WD40 repeat protein
MSITTNRFALATVVLCLWVMHGRADEGDKGAVTLYDPKRDKIQGGSVNHVVFSADGSRIAAADWGDTVKVWSAATNELLLIIFPSDYTLVANAKPPQSGDGLDAATRAVAFSPDGKRLAGAGSGKTLKDKELQFHGEVKVWDVTTGKAVLTLKHSKEESHSVVFSPDGKKLAVGATGQVIVWDLDTGKEFATFNHDQTGVLSLHPIAFSPDGKRLASGGSGAIKIWELATKTETVTLKHGNLFSGIAFSPDGNRLAASLANVGEAREAVVVWDLATGKQAMILKGATAPVHDVRYSADGKRLGVAMGYNNIRNPDPGGTIKVWDTASGKEIFHFKQTNAFSSAALAPDGKRIVAGDYHCIIQILKLPAE